ncbi:MAG: hypothetical protein ABDI19_01200 [Armatimonadota bacterium]
MARKRVALIIPTRNRAHGAFVLNDRIARMWKSILRLWGQEADIIVAGDVSKSQFNTQYDIGIVPYLSDYTSGLDIFAWVNYSPGDKPLYLVGYRIPQNTAGTPATGVLGAVPLDGSPTDPKFTGRRAIWTQSGTRVHVESFVAWISGVYHGLRVDESNPHLQVLLRPDPELHPQATHVYIARWHNRYFLPTLGSITTSPWLVPWIMVNEEADPAWSRPLSMDIDHICNHGAPNAPGWNYDIYLQMVRWLRTFCHNTGLVVQCGCTTSALSNLGSTSTYLHRNARSMNSQLAQIHQILLEEQDGCFPCCWHDHFWQVESTVGYANATTWTNPYGTFREFNSPAAFRAHWRGTLDEMRQMGFATSWCNRHRYLNFANNQFTDRYLRFLREETPVRAVRSSTGSCIGAPGVRIMAPTPFLRHPLERRYGIELFDTHDPLFSNNISYGTQPADRVTIALADGFGVPGESADILFARVLALRLVRDGLLRWLRGGAIIYHHNYEMSYEWPPAAAWVYMELDAWRRVLTPWLTFGSVSDLVAWRNRVRSML